MKTKHKINLIVVAAVLVIVATLYAFSLTAKWNKYSTPITAKNVVLGTYQAEDIPIDGTISYYYQVKATVKYSQATWPKIDMQVLKSDTLLLLHNCVAD